MICTMIGKPKFVLNSCCYSIYDKVFDFRSRLIYMFQFECQDEVKTEDLRKHCANVSGNYCNCIQDVEGR